MAIPRPEPRGYPGNLGLLFAEHVASGRSALVDLYDANRPREIDFRELDALCNAVARGLRSAGLAPGDRIAILSLNRHEFVATVLGAMRAGVVPVPINIKLATEAVHYIVHDAGAKLVFAETDLRRLSPRGVRVIEFGADGRSDFEQFLDPAVVMPKFLWNFRRLVADRMEQTVKAGPIHERKIDFRGGDLLL